MEVRIVQASLEILPCEPQGEGFVEGGVALSEGMDASGEFVERCVVVRGEYLALDD